MVTDMSTRVLLTETTQEAPVQKGSKWRVVCARPGQGSSGYYSPDVLKEYAGVIVPAGAQSYIQHDPSRNVKDMIGVFEEGGYWDEDEQAILADLKVFSHWKDFVAEVGPHAGMSLYASGELDEDGNVTQFFENAYNGVDLVGRPGLEGSGIQELLESARRVEEEETRVNAARTRKESMELEKKVEELTETVKSLAESVKSLVSTKDAEAEQKAQVKADEAAIAEALETFGSRVAKIEEATELSPLQRKSLMEQAKAGVDVEPLIEAQVAVAKELRESVTQSQDATPGRIFGESAPKSAIDLGKVFG